MSQTVSKVNVRLLHDHPRLCVGDRIDLQQVPAVGSRWEHVDCVVAYSRLSEGELSADIAMENGLIVRLIRYARTSNNWEVKAVFGPGLRSPKHVAFTSCERFCFVIDQQGGVHVFNDTKRKIGAWQPQVIYPSRYEKALPTFSAPGQPHEVTFERWSWQKIKCIMHIGDDRKIHKCVRCWWFGWYWRFE